MSGIRNCFSDHQRQRSRRRADRCCTFHYAESCDVWVPGQLDGFSCTNSGHRQSDFLRRRRDIRDDHRHKGTDGYFAPQTSSGLNFYSVSRGRVLDTRQAAQFPSPFGAPALAAGETRTIPVPSSTCGIPPTAAAFALNFTAIPPTPGYLGLLTTWPAGQSRPNAWTLNSYTGTVVANAAIVPAGTGGAINVYVSDMTDVICDINGYFAP
jgi:hypothetical protein